MTTTKARTKTKRSTLKTIPQNIDELTAAVATLGRLKRQINDTKSQADEEITRIQERLHQEVGPLIKELEGLRDGIYAYAESNRDTLTKNGKTKTVKLVTGTVSWRMTPWKISLKNVTAVVRRLKDLGLTRFIRVKEEPNKDAMLEERELAESVEGITTSQREEFVVNPHELDINQAIIKKVPEKKSKKKRKKSLKKKKSGNKNKKNRD